METLNFTEEIFYKYKNNDFTDWKIISVYNQTISKTLIHDDTAEKM